MKETKVYVDELPKSCGCCEFYSQDKYCAYCLMLNEKLRYIDKEKDCPLKSLHDHDKELVEKVLEKTKTFVRENTYICGGNATREDIITSSSYNQALRDVLGFMQTLQKEFEDE